MGLYTNSETTSKKDSIIHDIGMINKAFKDISFRIDSRGMNNSTINSINSILNNVEANITRMSSTVQSMCDSELTGFYVPWVDGRNLGIMTLIASFGTFMNKLSSEMELHL
jgi:hypothetical protein